MQAIAVQWQWCRSRFRSGRVGPCCQKQQTASNNQLVAAAHLTWEQWQQKAETIKNESFLLFEGAYGCKPLWCSGGGAEAISGVEGWGLVAKNNKWQATINWWQLCT